MLEQALFTSDSLLQIRVVAKMTAPKLKLLNIPIPYLGLLVLFYTLYYVIYCYAHYSYRLSYVESNTFTLASVQYKMKYNAVFISFLCFGNANLLFSLFTLILYFSLRIFVIEISQMLMRFSLFEGCKN